MKNNLKIKIGSGFTWTILSVKGKGILRANLIRFSLNVK